MLTPKIPSLKTNSSPPGPKRKVVSQAPFFPGAMFALESVGDLSAKHEFVAFLVSKLSIEP